MWSPDRPPTRPPRSHGRSASSVASLGGTFASPPRYVPSSTASVGSKSFHSAFEDDDSSCDDTYVSVTKSSKKESSSRGLFEDSPKVLKETTRVTNSSSARRSPGLPFKSGYRHTISRAESSGILDKLKSDINSLDIMRNSSYVEEASVFSGSVFDFDDENKSIASKPLPKIIERSRSVDRSYRREELRGPLAVDAMSHHGTSSVNGRRVLDSKRETLSSTASLGSRRTTDRKHHEILEKLRKEKEEMERTSNMERERIDMEHLDRELDQKEEKITKLQETIRGLKKEVVMEKDENERCSSALDDLKRKLHECKNREADTQSALREVMKNVEHERDVRDKEMQLASKVQSAEIFVLKEKLEEIREENNAKRDALQNEITEKNRIIDGLKRDINQLRSKLDDCTRSKADSDKTLRSQIERLEMRLDNETESHDRKVKELNEMHQTAKNEWMDKLNHLEGRLEEQGVREAQWTDELSMTRLELENLRSFSAALESQNLYLKESTEGFQNLERDYDDLKQYKVDSDQTIDDLKKELEVAHNAKAALARQVQTMKDADLKRDEHVSNMEVSVAKLGGEKQEYIARIEQLQNELSKSKSECQDAKVALETVNTHLQDAASRIEKSMKNERDLAKRVGELENENMKLASALSSIDTKMKQEVEAFNVEMANKDRHLKSMSQASNELEGKLGDLQREANSYKDQVAKLPQLEASIKDLTASLVQSEDKYSTLQSNFKATNVKLEESEHNYDQLDKKFRALQRERLEMEERERSYATNASKRECEQIDAINKLKKDKKEQVMRIEQLQEELAKTKREVAQTKDNHNRSKEQLRTALQSLDEMMKYIDGMKEESDEMIKALEGEAEGLMKRIGVLEKHREFDQQTIKLHEDDLNDRTRNIKAECQQKANDEMRKLRNDHEREIEDVKSRYECRIKELQSTIAQRSEIAKSLQEHGSSEVSNLIKRVAEITEKHSKDLRAMREKYEAELAEESSAKSTLKASLRELESKNEDLEEALKSAISKGTKSTQGESKKCDDCVELKNKLQEHAKRESKLRGELAQSKQLMTITQANEKLLEEHVKQLEAQIDTLVLDYEGKLRH